MDPVLLDTSVASLLHPKRASSPELALYRPDLDGRAFAASFQTIAELLLWADKNRWGPAARAQLELLIARCTIIWVDARLLRTWSLVMRECTLAGRRLEPDDAWIVATAVRHGLPLVTHDRDQTDLPIDGLSVITHLK
ncbi:MAG TPA: PIN domain-containing protein [Tepidisphaeraceae bacterium]|nr:PIN domain-containing protein [Tepidisphaeraceae bacterium]